jgi:hypothetical protein
VLVVLLLHSNLQAESTAAARHSVGGIILCSLTKCVGYAVVYTLRAEKLYGALIVLLLHSNLRVESTAATGHIIESSSQPIRRDTSRTCCTTHDVLVCRRTSRLKTMAARTMSGGGLRGYHDVLSSEANAFWQNPTSHGCPHLVWWWVVGICDVLKMQHELFECGHQQQGYCL